MILRATASTYVNNGALDADTNYGYAANLRFGYDLILKTNYLYRALLNFGIVDAAGDDTTVDSATLRLFVQGAYHNDDKEYVCQKCDATWDEMTVTWNNQPALDTEISDKPLYGVSESWSWIAFDVKTICQAILDEGVDKGFMVKSTTEGTAYALNVIPRRGLGAIAGKKRVAVTVIISTTTTFVLPHTDPTGVYAPPWKGMAGPILDITFSA